MQLATPHSTKRKARILVVDDDPGLLRLLTIRLRAENYEVEAVESAALAQERRLALTYAEARRDALTGLPNRRAFDEHLEHQLESPETETVAVTLLDVDDFKGINDTFGHAAGDEVLATLARIFMRAVRADEHVFRIGGDEFAVVIAGATEAGVRAGERILRAARLQRRGRSLPTLSGGVAH
jgi:GGDEF domain-containing protein